jgi:hypothetical protein
MTSEIHMLAQKYQHENVEAIQHLDNMGIMCRLQRKKTFELVYAILQRQRQC